MAWLSVVRERRVPLIGAALVLPLLVCSVFSGFRETVASATVVLVLVLVVVAAAATGDRIAGVVCALSSGAWFEFFLTQPYGRFTIRDPEDVEVTILLVLIGLAVTEVALWGRRQEARASRREGYLDGALRTAEIVSASQGDPGEVTDLVARQMVDVLDIAACRFVSGPVDFDAHVAFLDHEGSVSRGGHRLNVERDGLPTDGETALLVFYEGQVVGCFVLTSAADVARPSLEQRRVAVLLADQVGAVLGRQAL